MSEMIQNDLQQAVEQGLLQKSSSENILRLFKQDDVESWMLESVCELVKDKQWQELNDRFYKTLAFGTGGLRGRTIGKIITKAEHGAGGPNGRPQYPAVGSNAMNYFTVGCATRGLTSYVIRKFPGETPRIVISHDSRHFSREFAESTAQIISLMGGMAYLFEDSRSTPELSFAVRHLKAHAGIMITASHNPPHDNGYKVYFQDGGQVVEPHATAIIKEVSSVKASSKPAANHGAIISIGAEIDNAYLGVLKTLVIEEQALLAQAPDLRVVYTPLHGTGIRIIPRILEIFGINAIIPKTQAIQDGRFSTVQSPNPENPEAFAVALGLAKQEGADIVLATDPDADRMGVAARNREGEYEMLTGNQIGSLLAVYRLDRMFAKNILNDKNASHAAIIKTFVTTDLQKAIARRYGVKCIETLTGFKYIGEKLKDYEQQLGGRSAETAEQWRNRLLTKSTYYVFGGEESYGYSAADDVRDKDANAAVLMCVELAAYAASCEKNILEMLNELYLQYGFYWERLGTLAFEGAEGAEKIKKLLQSYKENSPQSWNGLAVQKIQNFAQEKYSDVDGKLIPPELMYIFHLDTGYRVAVRASGTEPKIKYYFFGRADVEDPEKLPQIKRELKKSLDDFWAFTQQDVKNRVG